MSAPAASGPDTEQQASSHSVPEQAQPLMVGSGEDEPQYPASGSDDLPNPLHPWYVVASAALGGFLFGYDTAIVNGGLFEMERSFGLDGESWTAGFVVSSAIIGAVLGAIGGGIAANAKGRRATLLAGDITFVAGALVLAVAPNIAVVIVGRIVLGVGIGIASIVVPMYIAEVTPPTRRGRAVVANNVAITGAQMIASLVAVAFVYAEGDASNPWGWRAMFGLAAIPAMLQAAMLSRMPESPSWLALTSADPLAVAKAAALAGVDDPLAKLHLTTTAARARESAALISPGPDERSASNAEGGINDVDPDAIRLDQPPASVLELFRTERLRPRCLLGVMLQVLQQGVGINTVMYYSATILKHAGYHGDKDPIVFSVPLAATNALATLISFRFVERFGRRPLLLLSLVGCAVFLVAFSGIALGYPGDSPPKGAATGLIVCLIGYLAAFAPGMGAIPWVVNSEIYPLRFRSAATSVATTANWVSNAVMSQLFPVVIGWIGIGPTFLIIVGITVLAFGFIWVFQPETRGLSLADMEGDLPKVQRTCFSAEPADARLQHVE